MLEAVHSALSAGTKLPSVTRCVRYISSTRKYSECVHLVRTQGSVYMEQAMQFSVRVRYSVECCSCSDKTLLVYMPGHWFTLWTHVH